MVKRIRAQPVGGKSVSKAEAKGYGSKIIEDFKKLFTSYSIGNEEYAVFTLHTIIGQMLRHIYFQSGYRKIDIRTQFLLLQPSGTGKGAGYGIACDLMRDTGHTVHKLTEASDAGLIGTVERYDEISHEYVYSKGLLGDGDFINMEEAGWVFDNSQTYSQNVLNYIQIACNSTFDSSCHIQKKLGRGKMINVHPTCSFFLLTYKPENLMETLLSRGMIQRFITVIRDVGLEDRMDIIEKMIEGLNVPAKMEGIDEYESILERLLTIKNIYWNKAKNSTKPRETKCFKIEKEAKQNILRIAREMEGWIRDASPKARQKLEEFIHRWVEMVIKISIHNAILELSNSVKVHHTQYAKIQLMPIWRRLMAYLEIAIIPKGEEQAKMNKTVRASYNAYKELIGKDWKEKKIVIKDKKGNVWLRRNTLVEQMRRELDDCSYNASDNCMKMVERKAKERDPKAWFIRKKYGSTDYVSILRHLK